MKQLITAHDGTRAVMAAMNDGMYFAPDSAADGGPPVYSAGAGIALSAILDVQGVDIAAGITLHTDATLRNPLFDRDLERQPGSAPRHTGNSGNPRAKRGPAAALGEGGVRYCAPAYTSFC